jgi:hypothetical protein
MEPYQVLIWLFLKTAAAHRKLVQTVAYPVETHSFMVQQPPFTVETNQPAQQHVVRIE